MCIRDRLKIPHKYGVAFSVNNITGFPTETKKLAFDTIELNRHFDSDNTNIHTFIPFHGTPLRKLCEQLGFIKPETITKCVTHDETSLDMPQYPPQEIKEIRNKFLKPNLSESLPVKGIIAVYPIKYIVISQDAISKLVTGISKSIMI